MQFADLLLDHSSHDCAPDFAAVVAAHAQASAPVVDALRDNGWLDVTFVDGVECDSPKVPNSIQVLARVPARLLGTFNVRAHVVLGRPAEWDDLWHVVGAARIGGLIPVLIADELADGVFVPDDGHLIIRTLAQTGLDDIRTSS